MHKNNNYKHNNYKHNNHPQLHNSHSVKPGGTRQHTNTDLQHTVITSSQRFANSKNLDLNHFFVSNKVIGSDRFRFVTSYWTTSTTTQAIDAGTSANESRFLGGAILANSWSSLGANPKLEVDTGEGFSTLAVVLQYEGVVELAGITAALKLPSGIVAQLPLTDDRNNYDIALSSYRGHIYPSQGIVLYFSVDVLPNAKVQFPGLGTLALHFLRTDRRSILDSLDAAQQDIFTKLVETFNFQRAYSSKSNQYRVTRSAQGDAIKKMSTMAYALDNKWNEPLIIQHNKKIEKIYLQVDRKQGRITPKFKDTVTIEDTDTDTEIIITMSPIKDDYDYIALKKFCNKYTLYNTHISYKFHFNEYGNNSSIDLSACHPIAKDHDNPNSVYCYSDTDFEDLLNDMHDKKMLVHDALNKSGFRELRQSGRFDYLKNITLEQLTSQDNTKIYHDLKKSMLPKSKLSVPYDTKYCKRKQALINRYQQIKPASLKIDIEKAIYKEAGGIHEDDHIRFPFIFEVLAIPVIGRSEVWQIIGGINYSTSANNIRYFQGEYTNTYQWTHAKTGQALQASDIMQIIRKSEAGEDISDEANIPIGKQRQQCIVIVHLVAPRIEYQSYGKSSLTLRPFQSVIAKTIEEVVSHIPLKSRYNPSIIKPPSVTECLRELLKKRWEDVRRNPNILDPNSEDYDAMTQSTVWYNLRKQYLLPIEEKYGVTIIKENTREDVTAKISTICENDLDGHPKREQLGIFASPRAAMHVDGSWHNVDIDEMMRLTSSYCRRS